MILIREFKNLSIRKRMYTFHSMTLQRRRNANFMKSNHANKFPFNLFNMNDRCCNENKR